ncbi:hypothetical protein SDRG_03080 [Saprolegnia diclina VS20]|uniref:Uncharacterized protein n=1 Tax=Saprolegnia diclina (strain VS20) TaxID=1156394 RepID=T0QNI3_SAPDV|nr:hypothetical protein SDRG_03080 [Saprolegnia diclina VS20]EQC39649.1 hypothetical protein SDRG_03080 [Saprolegnia diclina VS20]|eukprot:XP_008606921.1 hypothetical protein SDRG_03080 [Saprolegnia diclina VS20]
MWNALFGSDDDMMDPTHPGGAAKVIYSAGEEPDAMTMLLGRLTTLLERLGEAEHARKLWEEKARKLETVNQKLAYELEYSTDAELRGRIEDLTAMNTALTTVKATLEKEVETKEARVHAQDSVVKELEAKVSDLDESHAARVAELDELVVTKEETDREIQRLCRSLDQKAAEIATLTRDIKASAAARDEERAALEAASDAEKASLIAQYDRVQEEDQVKLATAANELAQLHATVAQLEAQLASLTQVEATLREYLAQAQAHVEHMTTELNTEKAKLAEAHSKIHRLEMDHAALKQLESTWKEDAIRKLTEQVQGTQDELSRMMELNMELTEHNVALEEELGAPNPALDHAQEHIQALEDELEGWRTTVDANNAVWTTSLEKEQATVLAQAQHIAQLEVAVSELETAFDHQSDSLRAQMQALEAQANEWRQRLEAQTTEWTDVQAEMAAAHAAEIRARDDAHAAQVTSLQDTIASIQLAKDKEVLALHAALVQEKEALRTQLDEALASAVSVSATAELETENAQLLESIASMKEAEGQWRAREASMEASLEAMARQASDSAIAKEQEHAASLAALNDELASTIAAHEAKVTTLQEQIANTQAFLEECEEAALEWERKYDRVYDDLQTSAAHGLALTDAVAALEADKAATAAHIAALETDASAKDQAHVELQANLASLATCHEASVAALQADHTTQLSVRDLTIDELQSRLQTMEMEANQSAANDLAAAQSKAAIEIRALQTELFAAHEECERLRAALSTADSTKSAAEAAMTEAFEAEKARLLGMLDQGKQAFQVLKTKHTQMLDEFRVVSDEKSTLSSEIQAQLDAAQRVFDAEKRQLQHELAATQKMLSDVHASANLSNEHLEEHIRELQHQMHLRENKFESETEDLLEEIASLNGQLTDIQVQNNVLSARSHRLARDLSQFMDLPPEDAVLIANPNTPNLWELLATGMEQLKSDLEVASTYASNLDQMDGNDNLQDASFSAFSPSNASQDLASSSYRDHEPMRTAAVQ